MEPDGAARVMFDFGDGTVYWEGVPLGENRTAVNATERAAAALGLSIEVQWYPFGAFVADIGDRDPEYPTYWHFLLWNASRDTWELAPVGASDVLLSTGDAAGWFLASDDPPVPGTLPLATPLHPDPVVGFRGDLQNRGVSAASPPTTPALRWAADLEGAEVGASLVGRQGVLYQVTWNGTYALQQDSGERLWHQPSVAGLSTPALVERDLVAGSRDGRVYRLDGETGAIRWQAALLEETQFTGISSSPTISQGRVLVGTFNESGGPGRLVSLNLSSGAVWWSVETGSIHLSSPAVHDEAVYVGVMGLFDDATLTWEPPYGLLSVWEGNGSLRWFFPTDGPVASSPALSAGVAYVTSRSGSLYGITVAGELVFRTPIGPSTSSPAVAGGTIYAASGVLGTEGKVVAVTAAGNIVWEFAPNGPVQSSITLASGHVLFATNAAAGTLYALNATDGSLAWRYQPAPAQYILATPVILEGVVFVASDGGFLYAVGQAEPANPLLDALPLILGVVTAVVVGVPLAIYVLRRRKA